MPGYTGSPRQGGSGAQAVLASIPHGNIWRNQAWLDWLRLAPAHRLLPPGAQTGGEKAEWLLRHRQPADHVVSRHVLSEIIFKHMGWWIK